MVVPIKAIFSIVTRLRPLVDGLTVLFAVFLTAATTMIPSAVASEYTPDNLYDYKYVRLANGLDVFMKPRSGAHNVSMRMVVHVGTYNFPCGLKETPHFLEHLLFTGTSKHSESQLDALIEDNGGSWNAATGGEKTTYQVDIYDQYAYLGLDTLYEILTDSQLTPENIERSRGIITREAGGEPSELRRWLYHNGIGVGAQAKADELLWPPKLNCRDLETADNITREDIVRTRKQYYVPNNMALIVVGNFDAHKMLRHIERSFGELKPGLVPKSMPGKVPTPVRQQVSGTFAPILGTEAHVALFYQTRGYDSQDVYSIILMNELMTQEMFKELRVEKGLAYAPSSDIGFDTNVGVLTLSSDAGLSRIDAVEDAMLDVVNKIRKTGVSDSELRRIKRRVLLTYAQGYEDNSSIASHYASVWRRFEKNGRIVNLERKLDRVTPAEVNRLVRVTLDPSRVIIAVSRPTLSYHTLYLSLAILGLGIVAVGGFRWWNRRR
jgi:predicted Zn-dependent peptidase